MRIFLQPFYYSGVRWVIVGLVFLALGLASSYFIISILLLPIGLGTLLSLLLGAAGRFFALNTLVFNSPERQGSLWKKFCKYQIANATVYAGGWALINLIVLLGINYLLATLIATSLTTVYSMLSHYFWVWKRKTAADPTIIGSA